MYAPSFRMIPWAAVALCALAGPVAAQEPLSCRGEIVSKQGEGLVVQTFRFEVGEVTGNDLGEVLEKCRTIAQQRQNKAARARPGVPFRKMSELDLACTQGAEKTQVRRTLRTAP